MGRVFKEPGPNFFIAIKFFFAIIIPKEDSMKIVKIAANVLMVVGLLLIVASGVGRFVGKPELFMGVRVLTLMSLANTALLLAILAKLHEKK